MKLTIFQFAFKQNQDETLLKCEQLLIFYIAYRHTTDSLLNPCDIGGQIRQTEGADVRVALTGTH